MNNANRISWKYDVSIDGVKRGMAVDEIKHIVVSNPKNARFANAISKLAPIYVRKAVGFTAGWYRRPRARQLPVARPPRPSAPSDHRQTRVTFMIAGCQITVPAGMAVEVVIQ